MKNYKVVISDVLDIKTDGVTEFIVEADNAAKAKGAAIRLIREEYNFALSPLDITNVIRVYLDEEA